ncbi:MAG: galactose mutarotase [Lachnospiraceae bacterium]|nr:galactose mutarotase [Lachnospiraceae bacterium]
MKTILLKNAQGMQAEVLPFGAVIRRLLVPDADGVPVNVVLGFADPERYRENPCYMGGAIGPVCSRTANAAFTLEGEQYHIPANEPPHNLHGDAEQGFHKREWTVAEQTEDRLTLTLHAPHLDLGFPGERDFSLIYALTKDNALRMEYRVTSDRKTFVNPTQHSYFNLDGEDGTDILRHRARFSASRFLQMGEGLLPTGEVLTTAGTPFDFSSEKEIGRDIDAEDEQLRIGAGYDHHFVIDGADGVTLRPFARFTRPDGKLCMEVSTTLPGFQFYTGNFFSCPADVTGRTRGKRDAFCVETSFPPNAVNMPSFPQPRCNATQPFTSVTEYRFFHADDSDIRKV